MSDEADEEIDWTHFTFQHGFRQLPQHMPHHLQQHFAAPPLSVVPSLDAEMSEASHSPSPSSFPPQAPITKQEPGLTSAVDHSPRPASLADQAEHHADSKQEAAQHAQHADLAPNGQGHAGHAELIEEQGEEALAGGMGVGADGEEGEQEGQEFDEESVEGQRLTRSRRGNAAGLYMLDHGSQLVPKKVTPHTNNCTDAVCVKLCTFSQVWCHTCRRIAALKECVTWRTVVLACQLWFKPLFCTTCTAVLCIRHDALCTFCKVCAVCNFLADTVTALEACCLWIDKTPLLILSAQLPLLWQPW